jgi:protein TonB
MRYGITGIPQVFIIDREGKVKWHAIGYTSGKEVELRSAVEKVLKSADPPAPVSTRGVASASPAEKVIEGVDPPPPGADGGAPPSAPDSTIARFSTGGLNHQPIKRVMPRYPPEARKARAHGPVQVEITVSESGKVIEAKAISGHESLRDAAEQAAMQWEFKPAEASGEPVKKRSVLTFTFNLQ